MTLDMWHFAEHVNPNGTAILNKFWCAALQPVIIGLATVPRFLLGQCRYKNREAGDPTRVEPWAWIVGALCWIGASAIFTVCLYSLVEFMWDDGTPPKDNLRLQDARTITALALVQIGYPLVSLYSYAYLHVFCFKTEWRKEGDSYPAFLSCQKDMAYAALDVTTKGGLAIYAASRAMWM